MGLFSSSWTGREPGGAVVVERPVIKSAKLEPHPVAAHDHLSEYVELAQSIGVVAPDLKIEDFKKFLRANDIPVFSLTEVVSYMDDKAAKESKEKCGWEWHPLRAADHIRDTKFGTEAKRTWRSEGETFTAPASDYYIGPHLVENSFQGMVHRYDHPGNRVYDKTVPIHALRKIGAITKQFGETIKFFVCDYALAPAIQYPDPFLMAVVPNGSLDKGVGRFIIDFWDEPGFGIDKMLK